jgi:ketosteroid isomerase-like protein
MFKFVEFWAVTSMRLILAATAMAVAMNWPITATASDKADVVTVIQSFNHAGNKGDRSGYISYCAEDAVVVDHVPPYLFQGPTACGDEYDAVVAWGTQNKIGTDDLYQKVYKPLFFEKQGDVAYAVFPVKGWFKQNGHRQVENLYLTAVLRRSAHSWRIARLAFASLGWGPVGVRKR